MRTQYRVFSLHLIVKSNDVAALQPYINEYPRVFLSTKRPVTPFDRSPRERYEDRRKYLSEVHGMNGNGDILTCRKPGYMRDILFIMVDVDSIYM